MGPVVRWRQLFLPSLALLFFMAACAETPELGPDPFNNLGYGPGTGGNGNGDGDGRVITGAGQWLNNQILWTQPPLTVLAYNKVDILFVIDTSGSLSDEINSISQGISQFIAQIPDSVDYRLAVLLAHINSTYSGKLYRNGIEPLVIEGSSSDPVAEFRAKLFGITNRTEGVSDGGEALLYAMTKLMRPENLSVARGQGFFRTDAGLVTIFVTDENDICKPKLDANGNQIVRDPENKEIPAFNAYCKDANGNVIISEDTVYAGLRALQQDATAIGGYRPLTIAGLIHTGENPVLATGENEIGWGIKELIANQNGVAVDLADPAPDSNPYAPIPARIAEGLADIGLSVTQSLSNQRRIFLLPHFSSVDSSSLVVKVDDTPVSYQIRSATAELEIAAEDAGDPGQIVNISYRYWQAANP